MGSSFDEQFGAIGPFQGSGVQDIHQVRDVLNVDEHDQELLEVVRRASAIIENYHSFFLPKNLMMDVHLGERGGASTKVHKFQMNCDVEWMPDEIQRQDFKVWNSKPKESLVVTVTGRYINRANSADGRPKILIRRGLKYPHHVLIHEFMHFLIQDIFTEPFYASEAQRRARDEFFDDIRSRMAYRLTNRDMMQAKAELDEQREILNQPGVLGDELKAKVERGIVLAEKNFKHTEWRASAEEWVCRIYTQALIYRSGTKEDRNAIRHKVRPPKEQRANMPSDFHPIYLDRFSLFLVEFKLRRLLKRMKMKTRPIYGRRSQG